MLDDMRTVLVKRANLDISYLSLSEVDSLLEKYYGPEWKRIYGIEEPEKPRAPISAYTGKSILQMNEEFFEKEKEKLRTKNKILGDKNV